MPESDPHKLMLNRLEFELKERKRFLLQLRIIIVIIALLLLLIVLLAKGRSLNR